MNHKNNSNGFENNDAEFEASDMQQVPHENSGASNNELNNDEALFLQQLQEDAAKIKLELYALLFQMADQEYISEEGKVAQEFGIALEHIESFFEDRGIQKNLRLCEFREFLYLTKVVNQVKMNPEDSLKAIAHWSHSMGLHADSHEVNSVLVHNKQTKKVAENILSYEFFQRSEQLLKSDKKFGERIRRHFGDRDAFRLANTALIIAGQNNISVRDAIEILAQFIESGGQSHDKKMMKGINNNALATFWNIASAKDINLVLDSALERYKKKLQIEFNQADLHKVTPLAADEDTEKQVTRASHSKQSSGTLDNALADSHLLEKTYDHLFVCIHGIAGYVWDQFQVELTPTQVAQTVIDYVAMINSRNESAIKKKLMPPYGTFVLQALYKLAAHKDEPGQDELHYIQVQKEAAQNMIRHINKIQKRANEKSADVQLFDSALEERKQHIGTGLDDSVFCYEILHILERTGIEDNLEHVHTDAYRALVELASDLEIECDAIGWEHEHSMLDLIMDVMRTGAGSIQHISPYCKEEMSTFINFIDAHYTDLDTYSNIQKMQRLMHFFREQSQYNQSGYMSYN